jgi:hypothetical protein
MTGGRPTASWITWGEGEAGTPVTPRRCRLEGGRRRRPPAGPALMMV